MTKAVIYARYSSDKQNEVSIEGQIAECRKYAKENDIAIVQEYVDRAQSATTDKRPSFLRMIDDSRQRNFEIILVYQLDRFARNRNDSGYYKKILADNGVKVVSAKEQIASDSSGVITEGMLEVFADYFSKQLSEKVQRGMYQNAEKCKHNGSTVPFGYIVDSEGHYQLDELAAPIVKEIFERLAAGESASSITRDLCDRKVKNSLGRPFGRTTIYNMMRNEKYKGIYIYDNYRVEGGMPRIVSDELFDAVQDRFKSKKHKPRPSSEDYLLTGKLYCGHCGAPMTGTCGTSSSGKVYRYYFCVHSPMKGGKCAKKNVPKDMIESLVLMICRESLTDEFIDSAINAITLQNEEDQRLPTIMRLNDSIKDVESKIEKLLDQVESGISTERIASRIKQREDELADLKWQLRKEKLKLKKIDPVLARRFLISLREDAYNGNIDRRPLLINLFIDKIVLYDDHFRILMKNSTGSEESTQNQQKEIEHYFDVYRSDDCPNGTPLANTGTSTLPAFFFCLLK